MMGSVYLKCAECEALLGSISNQWTKIGRNYLVSTAKPEALDKFWTKTPGAAKCGQIGTLIEGCELRDVQCKSCDANLGLKCVDTPEDHDLTQDQVIFRIASISIRSLTDQNRTVGPRIERVLDLQTPRPAKEPSEEPIPSPSPPPGLFPGFYIFNDAASADSGDDVTQLFVELQAQQADIQKIGNAGMQVVTKFEKSMGDVELEIQEIQGSVEDLEKDGKQRGDELELLRKDFTTIRSKCPHEATVAEFRKKFQINEELVAELQGAITKSQDDTEELQAYVSERRGELEQAETGFNELHKDLLETRKLAGEGIATAKQLAKRNDELWKDLSETNKIAKEGIAAAKKHSLDVVSLRKELKQLRAEMVEEKSARQRSEKQQQMVETERIAPSPAVATGFSSFELDILTRRIADISNRANQVESLQMEFALFKSRVQRLETSRTASDRPTSGSSQTIERNHSTRHSYDTRLIDEESPSNYLSRSGSQKRKRPSPFHHEEKEEEEYELDLPTTKRHEPTSDYYSAETTGSSSLGDGQESSPWTTATSMMPTNVRRTKSGAVDKRSLKYLKRDKTSSTKKTANG